MRTKFVVIASLMILAAAVLVGCGPEVPDVVGMGQADAVRALQAEGYLLGEVSLVATTGVSLGQIAAQTPAAGESAREGTKVDLAVSGSDGTSVLVPTVNGLTQTTAQNVATTLNLTPMFVEQYSDKGAVGEVVSQLPDPGAQVAAGSTLVMVLSKGAAPEKAKVPDVKGDSESAATSAIEKAGFKAEVFKVYNSDVAKGNVIGQVPDAGTSLVKGSTVQIAVSLGKGTGAVKVPTVTGQSESAANSAIQGAGFKVRKVTQYSSSVKKGVVAQQFPAGGSTAAKGSEVLIVVSLGAEPSTSVTVPDVMGQSVDAAVSAVQDAGLSASTQEVTGEGEPGVVTYQFPGAGTKVAPGSEVLIVSLVAPATPE